MLGNKFNKNLRYLGNKSNFQPVTLGNKFGPPVSGSKSYSNNPTSLYANHHTQETIYVPIGLKNHSVNKSHSSLEKHKK